MLFYKNLINTYVRACLISVICFYILFAKVCLDFIQTYSNLTIVSDVFEEDLDTVKYKLCLFSWGKVVFINGSIQFKKAEYYASSLPTEYIPAAVVKAVIMDSTAKNVLTHVCFLINPDNGIWCVTNPAWDGVDLPEIDHICTFCCAYIAKS